MKSIIKALAIGTLIAASQVAIAEPTFPAGAADRFASERIKNGNDGYRYQANQDDWSTYPGTHAGKPQGGHSAKHDYIGIFAPHPPQFFGSSYPQGSTSTGSEG